MTGVMDIEVDLEDEQVRVEHLADWIDIQSLTAAIHDAGYAARPLGQDIYTGANATRDGRHASAAGHTA